MSRYTNTILIVDDAEINRAILIELFLEKYNILEAENGRQALEVMARCQDTICAVLLDIVMPVMDGITVLCEMKRKGWLDRFPVILITASSSERTLLMGYDLGVSDIINKPFSPDIVNRRVQNVVELHAHRHRLEGMVHEQMAELETRSQELKNANLLLEQQAEKLKSSSNIIIDALSTMVEFRNGESGAHIKRMRRITAVLMQSLSDRFSQYHMPTEDIETISSAAAMHDIGKISIPDSVLLKPGRLTHEEFEIMKTHTLRGCELLKSLRYDENDPYFGYCYEICRHHHERWDGSGYPDHLEGDEIPIWSQVVSLADVYEALTSQRVYKSAYSHEEAVRMIQYGECGAFNPMLLQCFLEIADVLLCDLLSDRFASG